MIRVAINLPESTSNIFPFSILSGTDQTLKSSNYSNHLNFPVRGGCDIGRPLWLLVSRYIIYSFTLVLNFLNLVNRLLRGDV